jgi:bifunctional non-homologous end joining protein LigD
MAARCCQCSGVASETTVRAGRRRVRISNPGKLLFPADGITKADLAEYYAEVAPAMLPHVRDRPLNLWRWNTGIEG